MDEKNSFRAQIPPQYPALPRHTHGHRHTYTHRHTDTHVDTDTGHVACWPFVDLLWKNVCFCSLPIFWSVPSRLHESASLQGPGAPCTFVLESLPLVVPSPPRWSGKTRETSHSFHLGSPGTHRPLRLDLVHFPWAEGQVFLRLFIGCSVSPSLSSAALSALSLCQTLELKLPVF